MNHVVNARLVADSGNVLTRAVVAGLGIAQTFEYHVAAELARFSSSHGLWLTQRQYNPCDTSTPAVDA